MRAMALCLAIQLGLSVPAGAQDAPVTPAPAAGWSRGLVRYGKWITGATAVGLTIWAAREHASAQDNWRQLIDLCRSVNAACQVRSDGRYVDYAAELLYQRTAHFDRRARSRLIGGQIALLASAALFILDLRHQGGNPPNIPFHGLQLSAAPTGDGGRFELRVAF